jgi:hypothetical protein
MSAAAAESFDAHLAIEDGPTRLTYAELFAEGRTFAARPGGVRRRPG